jgi:hypothetical protein
VKNLEPLICFYNKAESDKKLFPTHLSLYLALIWSWQQSGFKTPFSVYRSALMKLGKIKSIATYHKCMNDLSMLGYIEYQPSYNYYKGSQVSLFLTNSWKESLVD